jgi:hypothetical protein
MGGMILLGDIDNFAINGASDNVPSHTLSVIGGSIAVNGNAVTGTLNIDDSGTTKYMTLSGTCSPALTPVETEVEVPAIDEGLAGAPLITPWSETWEFTILPTEPRIPMLQNPQPGAVDAPLSPNFQWAAVEDASSYTFQLAKDAAFTIPGWTTKGLTTNALMSEHELDPGTTYYWRVQAVLIPAVKGGTAGATSDWATGVFTTMTEAEPVAEKYACPQCGLVFDSQQELADHWAKYHAPVPADTKPVIPEYLLWVIIGVGAVLIIALIVLIVRTRRAI